MVDEWQRKWLDELLRIKESHAYRYRPILESPQGAQVQLEGKAYLNFSSNDYLGLANDDSIKAAFYAGVEQYGVGSGASHLVIGHSEAHSLLEQQVARWTGRSRALVFSSGYAANLAILSTLLSKKDTVFADKLNHASLVDGARASAGFFKRYRHLDFAQLRMMLENHRVKNQQPACVVTDSVFSMDGELADLGKIASLAREFNALLMVDDAHGIGVLGSKGEGCVGYFDLSQNKLPVLMGTFGKAVGCAGAFVAGSEELIELLIQRARNYIYTTAISPAVACAVSASIQKIEETPELRERLFSRVSQFRDGLKNIPFTKKLPEQICSETQIQPFVVGDNRSVIALSKYLKAQGILVAAIRPPTVPANTARLRISICANHSEEDIQRLLDALYEGCVQSGLAT